MKASIMCEIEREREREKEEREREIWMTFGLTSHPRSVAKKQT